jgi:hypothetical protein
MNRENLKRVRDRIATATGPDRELDGETFWLLKRGSAERIYWNAAMGLPKPLGDHMPSGLGFRAVCSYAPNYTASLDVALSLVESLGGRPAYALAGAMVPSNPDATVSDLARDVLRRLFDALISQAEEQPRLFDALISQAEDQPQ